jgi:hypothetical protein
MPVYLFWNGLQIQVFHFLACPWRSAQELQAGFYAWVMGETTDGDLLAQNFPTILFNQFIQDHLKRDGMQGIVELFIRHGSILSRPGTK